MFGIKMQHYSCDFAPVSTNRIRVEQAQIRDDVLLVVNGQYGMEGAASATSGSSGGFCMGFLARVATRKDVLYSRERTSSGRMQRSEMNGADVIDMICRQGWHL